MLGWKRPRGSRALWTTLAWPVLTWVVLALAGCGDALQAEDSQTQGLVRHARQLYDQQKYTEAEVAAGDVLSKTADSAPALYLRGLSRVRLHKYEQAAADLAAARKSDPLELFATDKSEYTTAVQQAADGLKAGQDQPAADGKPASGAKPPAAAPPNPSNPATPAPLAAGAKQPAGATPPAAGAAADPAVAAAKGAGAIFKDLSELSPPKVNDDQLKAILAAFSPITAKGVTAKVLFVRAPTDPEAEARRLYEAAGLDDKSLLVVVNTDGKFGAYNPTITPSEARPLVAETVAANADQSLARRIIEVTTALAAKVKPSPTIPPAVTMPPLPSPAAVSPKPVPAHPAVPLPWLYGTLALGAVVVAFAVVKGVARLLSAGRLARGFAAARPHLLVAADGLTRVTTALAAKRDRGAETALKSAELAFFDAVAMMSDATEKDTADTARVERAVRLLEEATSKVGEAEAALESAAPRTSGATHYCFFTARPIHEVHEGDLVALTHAGETRLVMASREAGDALRRGQTPRVRVVLRGGQPAHWATVVEFEPEHDFYHDRWGREFLEAASVPWTFSGTERVFVESRERPDYKLDLGG